MPRPALSQWRVKPWTLIPVEKGVKAWVHGLWLELLSAVHSLQVQDPQDKMGWGGPQGGRCALRGGSGLCVKEWQDSEGLCNRQQHFPLSPSGSALGSDSWDSAVLHEFLESAFLGHTCKLGLIFLYLFMRSFFFLPVGKK